MTLTEQLEAARAEVARLEQLMKDEPRRWWVNAHKQGWHSASTSEGAALNNIAEKQNYEEMAIPAVAEGEGS